MENYNDIRHGRHCVFLLHVHLVFITKYRAKEDTSLSAERLTELSKYVENSLLNFIGYSNFAKVKANTKLYNQLVK